MTTLTNSFSEKHVDEPKVEFDPRTTALIVVDMVNEFFEPGGKMILEGGTAMYPAMNRLLDAAHEAKVPVFYTNQWLRPDDALFKKRTPHCIAGTWGAQVVDALHQSPDDIVVHKRRYSAFYQTDLDLYLQERDIKSVIVTGTVTNICVRSTVHDAYFMGYDVYVPVECVAATSGAAQEVTLYDIETHYGTVTTLDEVLARLKQN